MKQLIARIDDVVHARLKARAAAEGRSLNALVAEVLEGAAAAGDRRADLRARVRAAGLLVTPPRPGDAPARTRSLAATRGAGTAASAALSAERAER